MAEAIERFIGGPERKRGVELSVVSVEGFATTDEEWEEVRHIRRGCMWQRSGMCVFCSSST